MEENIFLDSVVKTASEFADSIGLGSVAAQMYALLYLSPSALSLDEISEKLNHLEEMLKSIEKRKTLFIHSLHNPRLELNTAFSVALEYDGYQFIAYAPDLDIYGCDETEYEAIEDLRQSIVDLYFDLKNEQLGKDLQRIFEYLKSVTEEK